MQANELERTSIGKLLFTYAMPAIIATTASSLYNVIDRIFIGQGVGAMAIAGLAITFPIMNLSTAFGTLVGAGASSMVSIRMGERRIEEATRFLGNALILNIIVGACFAMAVLAFLDPILYAFGASKQTIPYAREFMQIILLGNINTHILFGLNSIMRSSGYPVKAMVSVLLTVVCNLVLAPIFLFVLHWGIRGAAFATVISQTIGMIWVLIHFCSTHSHIHFMRGQFRLRKNIIKDIFSIGLSPFSIHVCSCLVAILMNQQLVHFGGDMAIAAFGIINSVLALITMIILGLAQGMQPIVGYNYGAKNRERVFHTLQLTIKVATVICVVGFAMIMAFPQYIARAFSTDVALNMLTTSAMRKCAIMLPLVGVQMVGSFFFQSIGMAKTSIFLSLSRQIILLIPFILILPIFFDLNGIWYALPCADFCSTLVTVAVLKYKRSHILTQEI